MKTLTIENFTEFVLSNEEMLTFAAATAAKTIRVLNLPGLR